MAYYDYYRRRNPSSWGRADYMMDSPPAPGYQPQPQWRGFDYYRAHLDGSPDPSIFDYVWGRVRSHFRAPVSRRDAQAWHRRVYGGLADVSTMMPSEIGAAAGFEAWRFWEHHRGIYRQPLMDDRERETEALVGLAIGEAEKLWDYTRRRGDKYGKREALETSAAIAVKLHRKGGLYSGGVQYEDPYLVQDPRYAGLRRHRHRRRSSSISPIDYDDRDFRRGYSSGDDSSGDDRYRRSPTIASSYIGSPSVAPSTIASGYGYPRRRASSFYDPRSNLAGGLSPYVPSLAESALSTSPGGAIIIPPPASSVGGYYPSSSYGGYGSMIGSTYEYRDANGTKVHRTTHGDPTSEYGHLPPGTYMVSGGSSHRRRHRRYS